MEKQELLDLLTEIGTTEDDATRRERLTALTDEVTTLFDNHATLATDKETLQGEITRLKASNHDLFMQVQKGKGDPEPPKPEPQEKRKFENLFDEKGALK